MKTKSIHEDPTRTTPRGMIRYASEFYAAALAADEKLGAKEGYEITAPIPVMFLIGQSIELSLKAYLLMKGVGLRALRTDYGHGLHLSLRKAKELGLSDIVALTEDEESIINILDELYSTKQLQYIVTGAKTFPVFGPLDEAALKLLNAVAQSVGYPPSRLPHAL